MPRAKLTLVASFPTNYFLEQLAVRADHSVLITVDNKGELWYVPSTTAALPVEPSLLFTFDQKGYVICVADGLGRVLEIDGDVGTRRLGERAGIVPGVDLSENAVGTNAIGTAIADRRPLQVTASGIFLKVLKPWHVPERRFAIRFAVT